MLQIKKKTTQEQTKSHDVGCETWRKMEVDIHQFIQHLKWSRVCMRVRGDNSHAPKSVSALSYLFISLQFSFWAACDNQCKYCRISTFLKWKTLTSPPWFSTNVSNRKLRQKSSVLLMFLRRCLRCVSIIWTFFFLFNYIGGFLFFLFLCWGGLGVWRALKSI